MRNQFTTSREPGSNRTGLQPHPDLLEKMVQGTNEFGPTTSGDAKAIAENRVIAAKIAQPAGTMPAMADVDGERLRLLDKLGARLQFERTGTRLYDALISKLDAYGTFPGGPGRNDLAQIRDEEHHHALLVQELIVALGGDPTVVTPCANLQSIASRGIGDVLLDPRTTLIECLDAILVAELADRESWEQLASALVAVPGHDDAVAKVKAAKEEEEEHLVKVRGWITSANARSVKTT
ncbi:MAG: ferritin-like domain-containing protein [Kofleriaceae bacterium]